MDRLDAMSVLLSAVESGSLSRASQKLGLSLATVSRRVADLERRLNADLLIRSAKGLELTPAGRSYVTAARAILEQVSEAERAAAGEYTEPRGDLVVTAPTMFGRLHVLPVATSFLAAYPDVSVALQFTDRIAHFLDDQVDVAVRIGALPDSPLIATRPRIGAAGRVREPRLSRRPGVPATPDDLARHSVVSLEGVSVPTSWSFGSGEAETRVSFRARLSVNTIDAAVAAAAFRRGLVRTMSYQVADYAPGRADVDRAQRLRAFAAPRAPRLRRAQPTATEAARVHRFRRPAVAREAGGSGPVAGDRSARAA